MQRRAFWLTALVFAASAIATVAIVRQVSASAAEHEARWLTQLAAEAPDLVAERVRCLGATIDALRGALASSTHITSDQWRTYAGTATSGGPCRAVRGVGYIVADPLHVVHRSDQQAGFALDEAAWLRLFSALRPTDLRPEAGMVFGPTQAFGPASLALLIAAVPGAGPASPPRGWAALLVSPPDLFDGLVDPMAMRVRVEDRSGSGTAATVLDTIEPGQAVVLTRELAIGGRSLRLQVADARPTSRRLPGAVGAVAVLGVLQTLTLACLVYALASSRGRHDVRVAVRDASLTREESEARTPSLDQVRQELERTRVDAGRASAARNEFLKSTDLPVLDAGKAQVGSLTEPGLGEAPDAEDIIDPAEVLLRCNHNGDLGARTLQLFAESLPAELEALESAAAANDMEAVEGIAHRMRGGAATLAAVRLAGALTGVELFLKFGDDGPLLDRLADVRHESALLLGVVPQTIRRLTEGISD